MKFGIIGYGSIGQRHVNNLITLGQKDIVLLRKIGSSNRHNFVEFTEVQVFLDSQPDVVIIANPTSLHAEYLMQILDRNIHVMVEKPLVSTMEELQSIENKIVNYTGIGMTAYNMRFHPCVKEAKRVIENDLLGKIYSSRFFIGQYLPDWRPNADYKKSYSANIGLGGGVLFDLIHEIDIAYYLLGEPLSAIKSEIAKVSKLNIETEDLAEILYRTKNNNFISIHLDYLTRGYKRYIEIIGEKGSFFADLHSNKINILSESGDKKEISFPKFLKNDMYLSIIKSFIKTIKNKSTPSITLQEGLVSNRIAIQIRNQYYGKI